MAEYTSGGDKVQMCYPFEMLQPDDPADRGLSWPTFARMEAVAPDAWPCWAFSNHDVVRHITRWAFQRREAMQGLCHVLLMCLRGSVCLYQGEELGLPEADLAFEDLQDPYGIEFWPEFKGRDGCRTPMVWDHRQRRMPAFHLGKPWLPVPANIWPCRWRAMRPALGAEPLSPRFWRSAAPSDAAEGRDDSDIRPTGDVLSFPAQRRRDGSSAPSTWGVPVAGDAARRQLAADRDRLRRPSATGNISLGPLGLHGCPKGGPRGECRWPIFLKNVEKAYGEVKVFHDINLDIKIGRVHRLRRPLGLRQVHAAADDRRAENGSPAARCQHRRRAVNDVPPSSAASPWCSSPTRSIRT
jgi:hypothetical protein